MKLRMSLVFLSFAAANASAFQAKLTPVNPNDAAKLAQMETAFSNGHVATSPLGICDATSVSGCNCPFCTQLRSIGR
ncbi:MULTISPECIES: hypothetical protein [Dickeya]|uniref:Uncharacterized protein n=3 Tax=Dickeya TaxID=204037 RepID=A0AAE7D086_9GAMM|nr:MULTISPECIES: hypothetical protein [Dickeya]ACZ75395.1 conserved hypothetical protein [Dickeya parazeae Ech586]MBP2836820.1 hypothetical protein [Dickeya parazeae]MCA6991614.1 hypothetical protein [Dickeya oryzae]QIZ52567.1 hypothetical protein DWG24_18375 [Dickeya zeae]QYM92446.1 hypothetical protein FGI21_11475 [Dickeya zeae]